MALAKWHEIPVSFIVSGSSTDTIYFSDRESFQSREPAVSCLILAIFPFYCTWRTTRFVREQRFDTFSEEWTGNGYGVSCVRPTQIGEPWSAMRRSRNG